MSSPDPVDYQTAPERYRHWKLRFEGPIATLLADFDEDGGLRPGYKLKLNSYDLGVDIELNDAVNRIRFEHPRSAHGGHHQRARPGVLLGGQHLHARRLQPRLEGQLLQVHQRDPQRARGLVEMRAGSSSSPRSTGPAPAAATSWRSPATKSCSSTTAAAPSAFPRCRCSACCPAPAASPASPTSATSATTSPTSSAPPAKGCAGQKALDWRLVDHIAKPAQFAAKVLERALALAATSDRPESAKGVELTPIERTIEADALRYSHVSVAIDRAARAATFTVKGPSGPQPDDVAANRGGGGEVVSARARARTRRRDPVDAHQRARHRRLADQDRGRSGCRDRDGRDAAGAEGPLARARNDRLSAPHVQPARRHLAQPLRPGRGRLLLCRHAPGTGARLRPHLPSGAAGQCCACAKNRCRQGEFRRLSDGDGPEPARPAILRREACARSREGEDRRAARRGRGLCAGARHHAARTTSIGATR